MEAPGQDIAYVDYGASQQARHERLVHDLIDQLGLAGVKLKFADENGNYVSPR